MTTGLEKWGQRQSGGDEGPETHHPQEVDGGFDDHPELPQDDLPPAKKGLSRNAKIGLGALGVMVVAMLAVKAFDQGADHQIGPPPEDVVAPIQPQRQAPLSAPVGDEGMAPQIGSAGVAPAMSPEVSQAVQPRPDVVAASPGLAAASQSQPSHLPQQGASQNVSASPQPVALQQAPAAMTSANSTRTPADQRQGESDLRDQVAALKTRLASLDARLEQSEKALAEAKASRDAGARRPAQASQSPRQALAKKPTAERSEKTVASTQMSDVKSSAAPSPVSAKPSARTVGGSKVRTDYRIYANVDGRIWVLGRDEDPSMAAMVDPRSVLSDGSRVISVNAEASVVETSSGEIR